MDAERIAEIKDTLDGLSVPLGMSSEVLPRDIAILLSLPQAVTDLLDEYDRLSAPERKSSAAMHLAQSTGYSLGAAMQLMDWAAQMSLPSALMDDNPAHYHEGTHDGR